MLAALFAVFGVFSWAPAAVNCLFAGVLLYATWELGKKIYPDDDVVSFTGTALTVTSPVLAYVSHDALLDYALVALVALAVLAAARESTFTCPVGRRMRRRGRRRCPSREADRRPVHNRSAAGRGRAGCRVEGSGRDVAP
jgi:uncharacterized protein (DUF2062 family)